MKHALQDIFILITYQKLLIKLLMILLMKLLIKPEWRGVFQMYLIDFKRKERSLTYYPFLSAIKIKQPETAVFFIYRFMF